MSEFLLIVPEGWTQLDLDVCQVLPGVTLAALESYIRDQSLVALATELINGGVLPADSVINEAQIINGQIFLVRLG